MARRITCHRCEQGYDPQAPSCPGCGDATVVNQMWEDQGHRPPTISARAWSWGFVGAVILWLIFAGAIVYLTADG